MDIKECYRKMGGDFDDVMQRLGNESFIRRFVIRFLDDPSFQMIKDGIEKKDAELAQVEKQYQITVEAIRELGQ